MINVVRWCDSPKTIDIIKFELETPNEEGVLANPYSVEKISIYYLQRGLESHKSYEAKHYDPKMEKELEEALNEENRDVDKIKFLRKTLEDTAFRDTVFYSDAKLITYTGTPIWVEG
ncbi:MAG: hypothetical protein GTO02_14435, partial [Candidatus Dadabacteria bacterium]|nr:hypothetical protein [Candidatus Dadabacteria bacterium]